MHTQSRAQQRFYRVGRSLEFLPYSRSRCTLAHARRAPPDARPSPRARIRDCKCDAPMACSAGAGGGGHPIGRSAGETRSTPSSSRNAEGRRTPVYANTRARATGRRRAPPSRASAADQPVAAGSRPSLHRTTAGGVSEARAVRSPRTLRATTQVATLNGTSDTSGTL